MHKIIRKTVIAAILFSAIVFLDGCATTKINWDARIGNYTFDQAVLELGPPDKSAKLSDGTLVCEWLTQRGYVRGHYVYFPGSLPYYWTDPPSPDRYLRLTFGADGKLKEWKKTSK